MKRERSDRRVEVDEVRERERDWEEEAVSLYGRQNIKKKVADVAADECIDVCNKSMANIGAISWSGGAAGVSHATGLAREARDAGECSYSCCHHPGVIEHLH